MGTYLPDLVAELMALSARLKPSAEPDDQNENNETQYHFDCKTVSLFSLVISRDIDVCIETRKAPISHTGVSRTHRAHLSPIPLVIFALFYSLNITLQCIHKPSSSLVPRVSLLTAP